MDKVILSDSIILEGGLGDERPNDNQIIFGGTGTGKSMSVLHPTLAHIENSSFIATFEKKDKDIVKNAAAYFRLCGYKTHIWNIADSDEGEKIPDPLDYVSSDDDIQELASAIANANQEYLRSVNFDPFFKDGGIGLNEGLISYVKLTDNHPAMKKVIDLFYSLKIKESGKGITTSLDREIEKVQEDYPDSLAARKLSSFRMLPYTTACCIRDVIEKAIQNIFTVSIQNSMSRDAYVDFEKFATEKTAIFILTSSFDKGQYAFENLMFGTALKKLKKFAGTRENNRLPLDVKLLFGDFSCGFPIQNYEKMISVFRSVGISSLMLCQSLSQLVDTYGPEKSNIILDNVSAVVYFPGGLNQQTARYVSSMMENVSMMDVLYMPLGKICVFRSGQKPVIDNRYKTLEDPMYKKMMAAGTKIGKQQ